MRANYRVFAALAAFLVFVMNSGLQAVNTREIEKVRNKGVLDSEDLQIIDNFVAEAVQEMVMTKDFTSIADARSAILARASSSMPSAAAQYAEQFSESAYKYISLGLKQAEELTPQDRKLKVILNLLILIDGLEDLRLADLAIGMLSNQSAVICYWAVHSVTNAGIIKQLNSSESANLRLARSITEHLKELVEQAKPEIISLMAEFAAELEVEQGGDLLGQIADMRISKYADWTVDYELLDATILKLLCKKIYSAGRPLLEETGSATSGGRAGFARRFGQLYSYAIQRYVKGQDSLSALEKQQLVSVLVETEKSCVGKLLGPQAVIKKALESDDVMGLLAEHSRLLGDETKAGQLALKLNFDYGQKPDGSKRTAPLELQQPPKTRASK